MDFDFTEAEEAFGKQIRDFLRQELPPDDILESLDVLGDEGWQFARQLARTLAKHGWLGIAWPKEYGGQGRSFMEQLIFNEETAYARVPRGPYWFAIDRVGPTIIRYGTEEQKQRHLRPIIAGEVCWCQGFTEPNAGSDLASLQCRAVEDGDDFVVNGQKTWTSYGSRADWCILLVRTDPDAPKHRGISYLLLDMKTPGITQRPLIDMLGGHHASQVFLDNVRVPKANLVGEKNMGWYVTTATLDFERSGIHYSAEARHIFEELVEYVKETRRNGKPLAKDPIIRNKLAAMAIEIELSRLIGYRIAWMQSMGLVPNNEASMGKLFGTEMWQRLANTGMQILGLSSQLKKDSKWAPLMGRIGRFYLNSVAGTIYIGSSEIQRNIIATRGLGLPR